MKKIQTHNRVLEVPSTTAESIAEVRRVSSRTWHLLVESLDMFQRAEVVLAERTELAKSRHSVTTVTPEVGIYLQSDPVWKESIATADYALKRMTALAATAAVADQRLAALVAAYPEKFTS